MIFGMFCKKIFMHRALNFGVIKHFHILIIFVDCEDGESLQEPEKPPSNVKVIHFGLV